MRALLFSLLLLGWYETGLAQSSAQVVPAYGYPNCVELKNGKVKVILEPNLGGRVIAYQVQGKNVLYVDSTHNGKTLEKDRITQPSAGRFDIGPEATTPRHPLLWAGSWSARIINASTVKLSSQADTATGVKIERIFRLSKISSRLSCTQRVTNVSLKSIQCNHWSRTFALGGGISLSPKNPQSRFPMGYCIYRPQRLIDFRPATEANVRLREGIVEILNTPSDPKFVMDGIEGWLAYLAPNDLLFVKKFPIYPRQPYAEVTAATASIWYFQDKMVEIEPIGPAETLKPGQSFAFTEKWWLLPYPFPQDRNANLGEIRTLLKNLK